MRALLFFLALAWMSGPAPVQAVERSIVLIECKRDGQPIGRGSGVVVSAQGHVLTARHVVWPRHFENRNGITCEGTIPGVKPTNTLVIQPTNVGDLDAALMRFQGSGNDYEFVGYCTLEDWMVRRSIYASGFPGDTQTGVPSFREGVLSTTFSNPQGLLETDTQTVEGMSGGPVFSRNLQGIVGIVIGAKFTATGTVEFYGTLPAAQFANQLQLSKSPNPCFRRTRQAEIVNAEWKSGDAPTRLGVRGDEGACFLAGVKGQFNNVSDTVSVELRPDGEYWLTGDDHGTGVIVATARCMWFD